MIENEGNSCYLNVIVQILHSIPEFRTAITTCLPTLHRLMSSNSKKVSLYELIEELGLETRTQMDISEVLYKHIIPLFEKERCLDLVNGNYVKNRDCPKCNELTCMEENFIIMPLHKDPMNEGMLTNYLNDILFGKCMEQHHSQCAFCKNNVKKTTYNTLVNLPKYLWLYDMSSVINENQKARGHWAYEEKMNLGEYDYDLLAVVYHFGRGTKGHYTVSLTTNGKDIYNFDDDKVTWQENFHAIHFSRNGNTRVTTKPVFFVYRQN